jgi:hypothetical protein
MMAKQRKRRSRRKLYWPPLGDPIPCFGSEEHFKQQAEAEQYSRMLRLKDHFKIEGNVGGKPWYALALVVASNFDEGLKIRPYAEPKGETAPRWKGAPWQQLKAEVAAVRHHNTDKRERWCVRWVYEQLPHRFGDLSFEDFYKRYTEAKRIPKR